jgi:hypothetical protein
LYEYDTGFQVAGSRVWSWRRVVLARGMPLYAGLWAVSYVLRVYERKETGAEGYPKITSGRGTEGLAFRKSVMVCAYAEEIAETRAAEWKTPALKKYGDSACISGACK